MLLDFKNKEISKYIFNANFGLERESLRVDSNGALAQTPHPFKDNPNIDRDFCENQVEIITNPYSSPHLVWSNLALLHNTVTSKLVSNPENEEFLWPFSNPPYFKNTDDIPVAHFEKPLLYKQFYREYLSKKYGKRKMLFSGIHYNFSFGDELLKAGFENSKYESYIDYKNQVYLNLSKNVVKYSWLIVYLMSASPVFDSSLFDNEYNIADKYASLRCSQLGYWNDFIPILNYDNLDSYVDSIEKYIKSGKLKTSSELYYPVRLKPQGINKLENLKENGVNHIELRMLDLNPLSPIGIFEEDIAFLHMFLIYLSTIEENDELNDDDQILSIKNMKRSAEFDEDLIFIKTKNKSENIRIATNKILDDMDLFFKNHILDEYKDVIAYQKGKISNPQNRYAVKIKSLFENNYNEKGLELAKSYSNAVMSN